MGRSDGPSPGSGSGATGSGSVGPGSGSGLPRLTSAQAAARLEIKTQTLYAYVARGLLERSKGPEGSTFDALEVERFAANRRRLQASESPDGRQVGAPLMVIETTIALIEDDELYFCGRRAADLALSHSYDNVAQWLWTGELSAGEVRDRVDHWADPEAVALARRVVAQLPPMASLGDQLQVATTALGAVDPLRYDLSPTTVTTMAGRYLSGVVDALPDHVPAGQSTPPDQNVAADQSTAARLWPKLTALPPTETGLRCLNAALVLLVDHDLAISTLAARAAASARANPYAVVASGLSALDSALHGNASIAAHRLLSAVLAGEDPERAIADSVLQGAAGIPGFGHRLYRGWDPRARVLLEVLEDLDSAEEALTAAHRVIDIVQRRTGRSPNVDLALATLVLGAAMRPDAGEAIFAVSRSGGWLAHALAEYDQPPLRLRPVGHYVGP